MGIFRQDYHKTFQHTAARRRLAALSAATKAQDVFQHTAARRRLVFRIVKERSAMVVSTHSRPKAAGPLNVGGLCLTAVSTHSRPKAAGASLKSLAPSGFAALISLSS